MVALVEVNIPPGVNRWLLLTFGATSAGVVGVMLISTIMCTFILVAVNKFDAARSIRERYRGSECSPPDFHHWWQVYCEGDWTWAFSCFNIGIPLFICVLAQVGWITFHGHDGTAPAAGVATGISFLAGTIFFSKIYYKWQAFLTSMDAGDTDPRNLADEEFRPGLRRLSQDLYERASATAMGSGHLMGLPP
ncbi:unnamed protein product [Chrysoparadoxa australica]